MAIIDLANLPNKTAATLTGTEQIFLNDSGVAKDVTVAELKNEFKEDFGTSSGASLVGYMPAGVGAVATNLQSVLHQVTPSYWDGVTDSTAAINALFVTSKVVSWSGPVYINGTITVPAGKALRGFDTLPVDSPKKSASGTVITAYGSWLICGPNAQIILNQNSEATNFGVYYPTQNYNIVEDLGQPDKLSPLVVFPPTFVGIGTYNAPKLSNILYLGGTTIFYADSSQNMEKLTIRGIRGCATGIAFDVAKSTDIIRFSDILLNPNSLHNIVVSFQNFATKLVKNFDVFRFSNNDGADLSDVFVFGCRTFADIGRSSASLSMNNIGVDVCHTMLLLEGVAKPFAVSGSNIWVTPLVYKPIIGGVESTQTPALVRFGATAQLYNVNLTNVKTFGKVVTYVTDTNKVTTVLQCSTSNIYPNTISIVNADHKDITGSYSSGISFINHSAGDSETRLSVKNVTVNYREWGSFENVLVDGWGEETGDGWLQSGVVSISTNLAQDSGAGLRVNLAPSGYLQKDIEFWENTSIPQGLYMRRLDQYGGSMSDVNVTMTVIDSTKTTTERTMYNGAIDSVKFRTDLFIPAPVTATGKKYCRIKITNTGVSNTSFSFVAGFGANCYMPKFAPCAIRPRQSVTTVAGNASITILQARRTNVVYDVAITTNRTVTADALPFKNDVVRVARKSTATGAFTVTFSSVTIAIGQWREFAYTGASWVEVASGTLI